MKKNITKPYKYTFQVSKSGLAGIFVSARCKAKGQDGLDNDEDLRVKINGLSFRENSPQKNIQKFNIPPAFNGSKLKGLKKKIIFLTVLKEGENAIDLIPQNSAFVESIEIEELSDIQNLNLSLDEKAEDGDRRPWVTLVLVDLPLKTLSVEVTIQKRLWDSDDVKIIIDGNVKNNVKEKRQRFWYLAGGVLGWALWKIMGKKKKIEVEFDENLNQGIHYIEFWADRMPILHNIKLDLGIEMDFSLKAKVFWDYSHLREEPNTESKVLIEKIGEGTEVEILEKAVKGERYRNPSNDSLLSTNRWHKVKYENQIGYIYSLALEIEGEDKKAIQRKVARIAEELDVKPEMVLALSQCESNFFPYTVSFDEDRPEVAFGVMQLSEILLKDLNNETKSFYSPVNDVFDLEQNIRGGVSFFKYLYDVKYKNGKDRLRKSVAAYNAGTSNVGVDEPLELHLHDPETQRIVSCAQNHLRKESFKEILKSLTEVGLVLFLVFQTIWFASDSFGLGNENAAYSEKDITANVINSFDEQTDLEIFGPDVIWDRDLGNLVFYNSEKEKVAVISVDRLNLGGVFDIISETLISDLVHAGHNIGLDIIEPIENIFYFPVTTSTMCGAQNCTHAIFKFDVEENKLDLVDNEIFGASMSFYLSPDNRYLAIVRGVHGGFCNAGNYLGVINLEYFEKDKVSELMNGNEDYTVNFITSLKWLNNGEIGISTEQYNCNEKVVKKTFVYDVEKQEFLVVKYFDL
ncbi:MAG: lytic transglycosylase domain-containing protein [Proteobacteria bacterium]|nr:lytic transglycosylase domain-containing protein [Pseudomonadota bacterium]